MLSLIFVSAEAEERWSLEVGPHPQVALEVLGMQDTGGSGLRRLCHTSHPPWGTPRGLWGSASLQPSLGQHLAASGSSSETQPEGKVKKKPDPFFALFCFCLLGTAQTALNSWPRLVKAKLFSCGIV